MVPIAIGLNINWVAIGDSAREQHVIPASHDLTNVIYRGVAGKEKGGQGRAPSPYQLLLDKLVKSNLLCYTRTKLGFVFLSSCN